MRVGNCMRVMGDLPGVARAYEQALACSSHNGGEGAAAGGQQQHTYLDLYATLGAYMNCFAVSCAEPSFTGILNTPIHPHNSSFHFFAHSKLWQPRSIGRWGSTTRPSAATPRPSATAPATHPPGRGWRRWRRRRETLRWRWRATKKVSEPLVRFLNGWMPTSPFPCSKCHSKCHTHHSAAAEAQPRCPQQRRYAVQGAGARGGGDRVLQGRHRP